MKIFLIDYSIVQDIEDYFARSFGYYRYKCSEDFLNKAEYSTIRLAL